MVTVQRLRLTGTAHCHCKGFAVLLFESVGVLEQHLTALSGVQMETPVGEGNSLGEMSWNG